MRGQFLSMAGVCLAAMLAMPAQDVRAQAPAANPAPIEYFRLFPGFVGEVKNEEGWTTGFAAANPWGQYTAYLMSTNARGQRTIRIEHYVPRSDNRGLQGSTMYLLEGRDRALLIDTANPAVATEGVNDLKTVVRYILGHESDGKPKAQPLDFVVANTHSHGDHIGENKRMSDRTVYYMDGDWPANAPANYVPIRAGGGATTHGNGRAVSEIDLGDRKVTAVALPPHTPGSTGYLDAENQLLISGDALGSAFVWVQIGPLTRYQQTTHELAALTAPYPRLVMLGSHFYQYGFGPRKQAPINGRPGDRQYILDQAALADGVMNGTIVGEPYEVGRETVWATHGSAQAVYSLATLYPPGAAPTSPYHAIRIPSSYPERWQTDPLRKTLAIHSDFHQITGPKGEVFYLLKGSKKTLLIGSGSGARGLPDMVLRLGGAGPLEVALPDNDPLEFGGLPQLARAHVYAPARVRGHPTTFLKDGLVIDLGLDNIGRPLRLTVSRLSDTTFTLTDTADRILFAGNTLGRQGADSGWAPPGGLKAYRAALTAWRAKTDGRYDFVYTARNYQWLTSPAYVDQLGQALDKALAGDAATTDSKLTPGLKLVKSDGAADIAASVGAP